MKEKYKFKMRTVLLLSCFMLVSIFKVSAQTITLNAVLSGTTTAADVSTPGDLTNICSSCDRGYIKFDLTSIPVGATVTGATIKFVAIAPSASSTSTVNKITSTTLDAATPGAGFYAALNSSPGATGGSWAFSSLPNTFLMPLIPAGITNLNTALGTGQITYGVIRGSTNVYTFAGYNNSITANQPQLIVDYALPCTGTPVAGTASAPTTACSGANFNLALAGYSIAGGLTFQWQSSPDGIVPYVNIAGATTATASVSQTAATFYQCIVTCTASGLSDTSNAISVAMSPFFSCYCASGATQTGDTEVGNVTVGALNNSSTCSTTGGAGSVLNLYSNYTALPPVNFAQSTIVPFSLEMITCGGPYDNSFGIYIDFNQNGSFADPGEEVYAAATLTNGPHIETGTFTVPLTATLGVTGMRIVGVEGSPTPCGTYGYGETEDYSVNITPAPACIQPNTLTASGSTTNSANLAWTAGGTETNWDVYYGLAPLTAPTGSTIPSDSTVVNSYNVTGLTSLTAYQYYVRADCGGGVNSAWTGPYDFNTICGGATCNYVFVLSDLYDSWNGASIDIRQNGVLVQNVTLPGGPLTDSILVPLCDGATTTLSWNRGSYPSECSFELFNPFNVSVAQFSDGSLLAEDSVFTTFATNCTPPACPQPFGVTVTNVGPDSAIITWSCPTCTGPYIIEYDTTGFAAGTGTADTVLTSPYPITGLNQGTVYEVYVSQDCSGTGDGESTLAGPYSFTTTVTYDNVCGALPLTFGTNGPFQTSVGTVEIGEPAPPAIGCQEQTGWCNSNITNTLWFTFVAPASGRVKIQSPGFDTQLAIWSALTCDTILNGGATLVAANDDDADYALHGGVNYSSLIDPVNCLTPGATYYVQLDAYSTPGGSTTIILTDLGAANASFTTLAPTYCTVDSSITLVPVQAGGVFSGAGVTGSTFSPSAAGVGTHTITYMLSACDSTVQTIVVDSVPVASYTYFNVANVITFTNTTSGTTTSVWDFGDGSPTSTVANPIHTYTANGAYLVQLIVSNACGVDTVTNTIVITGIGIDEIAEGSVSIYPNPTNGAFNVTINNANFSELRISIVDIQGKEVFTSFDRNVNAGYNKQINVEGLSKGLYFIKLNTGSDSKTQKLIIQ